MAPIGCWGLPVVFLTLLCCPGSGKNVFEVYMWPEQVVVKHGEAQIVNCSTNCCQPESGGLETTLNKKLLKEEAQWKQYLVYNVTNHTVMQCYFNCGKEQKSKTGNVTVFHPPEQVLLKLQPTWVTLGGSITIECRVSAVAPLEKLTLTLLHGKKTLHNETFERVTAVSQEARITYNITADKEHGNDNFSCKAELNLESLGKGIIYNVSEPQGVKIYEPKEDNQMVIIITVVLVLLLFVTSVLLCFVFGQRWNQRRRGTYGVQAAWRRLRWAYRIQAA